MSELWAGLSALCLALGSLLCLTGAVGLLRFPDFFTRIHAVGVTDTLATPLLLLGLILQLGWCLDSFKLGLVVVFVLATNPTASHAMAKAALDAGLQPQLPDPPARRQDD